jgi:hypothetical protein
MPVTFKDFCPEVLAHIFSFIAPYAVVKDAGRGTQVVQALVLMHVSRQFRHVILQRPFWRRSDCDFEHLVPSYHPSNRDSCMAVRVVALLDTLLGDPQFVSCLQRKTDWSFWSLETFWTILHRLPGVRQTLCRINLSFRVAFIESALSSLDLFPNLVNLSLHCGNESYSLNLDMLTKILKNLNVKRLHIGYPLRHRLEGSLKGVEGLEELSLVPVHLQDWRDVAPDTLLPYASVKSLTRLTLYACTVSLGPFVNVQQLRAKPKGFIALDNMLKSYDGRLTRLTLQLDADRIRPGAISLDWLQAKCLRTLTHLEVELKPIRKVKITEEWGPPIGEYIASSMFVVGKVAQCLPLLEDAVFWAGLDISKVRLLSSLRYLERLSWNCPMGCVIGLDSNAEVGFNDRVVRRIVQDIPSLREVTFKHRLWTMREVNLGNIVFQYENLM